LGGDALTWSGALSMGQIVTRQVSLKLADAISAGTIITLPVEFRDADQAIRFTRAARINVAGPQLALSYTPSAATAFTDRAMTWTLAARNVGALSTPVTVAFNVPFNQTWIDGSLKWNTGLLVNYGDRLGWLGTLGVNEALTVTYRMTTPGTLAPMSVYGSASAATDQAVWQAGSYLRVEPYRAYLPVVRKSS
ncbi:MAG: hypothetical protein HGB05_11525, partial [Chloroflexi bacterium]|nr:hypothetical protein [Chloroflexota bacterium]